LASERRLTDRTSAHLDMIRGISAIAVLVYHLRGLFFVDFPFLSRKTVLSTALYGATSYGHQAVIIFFVLSGYFISTSVIGSVREATWSWRTYLVSRLTRLQLVLFPALLLGAMWDRIGMKIAQASPLYYDALYKFNGPSVALRSTVPVFLGNLFFLQGIASPVFGSNGPLWSLSYEFWYYVLFPLLFLTFVSATSARLRIFYSLLGLAIVWFIGLQISFYFLIWLAGVVAGVLARGLPLKGAIPGGSTVCGLVFVSSLVWCRIRPLASDLATDCIVGLCFAAWLLSLLLGSRRDVSRAYSSLAKKLAGFSYTLYLTHFPLLLLLRGLINPHGSWQPDRLHVALAFVIGLSALSYAHAVAEVTEGRTAEARRALLRLFALRQPRDASEVQAKVN